MGYGIMRTEKRSKSACYGLQAEACRTRAEHEAGREFDSSDIDWDKTDSNIALRAVPGTWAAEISRQIKEAGVKARKDSVVMIDTLYTASPAFFEGKSSEEVRAFFEDCLAFHDRTYGRAFSAVIHVDEATPHMHVASVPLVEDEKGMHLSAKLLMGGRADYRARQDAFWDQVASRHGLDRGEVKAHPAETRAHMTKREWQISTAEDRAAKAEERALQASERLREANEEARDTQAQTYWAEQSLQDVRHRLRRTEQYLQEQKRALDMALVNKAQALQEAAEASQRASEARQGLLDAQEALEAAESRIEALEGLPDTLAEVMRLLWDLFEELARKVAGTIDEKLSQINLLRGRLEEVDELVQKARQDAQELEAYEDAYEDFEGPVRASRGFEYDL